MPIINKSIKIKYFIIIIIIVQIILFVSINVLKNKRADFNRALSLSCKTNLTNIYIALNNYHDSCGCYPPAITVDTQGNPMHSWRTLIIPYFPNSIYNPYNYDEPWNSPSNISVIKSMPSYYSCPNDLGKNNLLYTNYVAVIGPKTVFPGAKSTRRNDFQKNTNPIMLIEVNNSKIIWTQPIDIDINNINSLGRDFKDYGGPALLLLDGKKIRLSNMQNMSLTE
jgi:hypothetical protein